MSSEPIEKENESTSKEIKKINSEQLEKFLLDPMDGDNLFGSYGNEELASFDRNSNFRVETNARHVLTCNILRRKILQIVFRAENDLAAFLNLSNLDAESIKNAKTLPIPDHIEHNSAFQQVIQSLESFGMVKSPKDGKRLVFTQIPISGIEALLKGQISIENKTLYNSIKYHVSKILNEHLIDINTHMPKKGKIPVFDYLRVLDFSTFPGKEGTFIKLTPLGQKICFRLFTDKSPYKRIFENLDELEGLKTEFQSIRSNVNGILNTTRHYKKEIQDLDNKLIVFVGSEKPLDAIKKGSEVLDKYFPDNLPKEKTQRILTYTKELELFYTSKSEFDDLEQRITEHRSKIQETEKRIESLIEDLKTTINPSVVERIIYVEEVIPKLKAMVFEHQKNVNDVQKEFEHLKLQYYDRFSQVYKNFTGV